MKEAKKLFFEHKGDLDYLNKHKTFEAFSVPEHVILDWKNTIVKDQLRSYKSEKINYYNLVEGMKGLLKSNYDIEHTVEIMNMAYDELSEIDLFLWEMVINWYVEISHTIVFSYNAVDIHKKMHLIESLEKLITAVMDPENHVEDYVYGHICKTHDMDSIQKTPLNLMEDMLASVQAIKLLLRHVDAPLNHKK